MGVHEDPNGDLYHGLDEAWRYEGEWYNGMKQGHGIIKWENGDWLEGNFHHGRIQGRGVLVEGGKRYEGDFHKGMKHGFGITEHENGDKYVGQFWRGRAHGYGILELSDGGWYEGQFRFRKKHGFGTQEDPNGDFFEGQFKNGSFHGRIFKTSESGEESVFLFDEGEEISLEPVQTLSLEELSTEVLKLREEIQYMRRAHLSFDWDAEW